MYEFRKVHIWGARRFYFVGGATIPWQCADSFGGASIREGASDRDITVCQVQPKIESHRLINDTDIFICVISNTKDAPLMQKIVLYDLIISVFAFTVWFHSVGCLMCCFMNLYDLNFGDNKHQFGWVEMMIPWHLLVPP